jgi:hypothetical protein
MGCKEKLAYIINRLFFFPIIQFEKNEPINNFEALSWKMNQI